MAQQGAAAPRSDPLDRVQLGGQGALLALLALVLDGEAVGLVADPLQQQQAGGVGGQLDRVLAAGEVDLVGGVGVGLELAGVRLGQGRDRHLQARRAGGLDGHVELPLAPVHQQQVREPPAPVDPGQPPGHDLAHGGVVVGPLEAADAEQPVALLQGLAVLEHHHRRHRVLPGQVADVVALDPVGDVGQVQPLAQLDQAALDLLPAVDRGLVPGAGVLVGQLEQRQGFAPLGHADPDLPAGLLAQDLRQRVGLGWAGGDQQLGRGRQPLAVQLQGHPLEHLAVLLEHLVEGERLGILDPAVPHRQHGDGDHVAVPVQPEHVPVLPRGPLHPLLLGQPADHRDPVPQPGGVLEAEIGRGRLHPGGELADHAPVAPLEQPDHLADLVGVLLLGDVPHAGRGAVAHVELDARPLVVGPEDPVGAVAQLERLADQPLDAAGAQAVEVGAEVAVTVLAPAADQHHPGPGRAGGQLDRQPGLVVLELDVVPGLKLLDQVVLEDQGFLLVARHHPLQGGHPRHQVGDPQPAVPLGLEVAAHPRPQVVRLADVEDHVAGVAHQVHARRGRDAGRHRLQAGGLGGHGFRLRGGYPTTWGRGRAHSGQAT